VCIARVLRDNKTKVDWYCKQRRRERDCLPNGPRENYVHRNLLTTGRRMWSCPSFIRNVKAWTIYGPSLASPSSNLEDTKSSIDKLLKDIVLTEDAIHEDLLPTLETAKLYS
jgi:hypothetical protein